MTRLIISLVMLAIFLGCQGYSSFQKEAQQFIDDYTRTYQDLYYKSAEAEWASNTRIVEGDSTNAIATRRANEALADFTGSSENISKIQTFLAQKDGLTPL